jgi:hypothetical protein
MSPYPKSWYTQLARDLSQALDTLPALMREWRGLLAFHPQAHPAARDLLSVWQGAGFSEDGYRLLLRATVEESNVLPVQAPALAARLATPEGFAWLEATVARCAQAGVTDPSFVRDRRGRPTGESCLGFADPPTCRRWLVDAMVWRYRDGLDPSQPWLGEYLLENHPNVEWRRKAPEDTYGMARAIRRVCQERLHCRFADLKTEAKALAFPAR